MGVNVQNRSWPAINTIRSYPVVPWATRMDISGSFKLPDDFLVELYFPVGPDVTISTTQFFIQRVAIYSSGLAISLGYADGSADGLTVATASIGRSALTSYLTLPLHGMGVFAGSIGKVTIGQMDGIDAQGGGQYTFSSAATQLDVDCIRPQLQGVTAIRIADNNGLGPPLSGDIRLTAGSNMRITNPATGRIRFDAIQGEGLNEICACDGLPEGAVPISSINGLTASSGAFIFSGDPCLQISDAGNGLQFSDECSAPCCGCEETQQLERDIQFIRQQIDNLRDFQNRLQTEVNKMNSVVIASRVNDTGCVSCE